MKPTRFLMIATLALTCLATSLYAETKLVPAPAEEEPVMLDHHSGATLVQPELILFTLLDFREYEPVKKIQEQMYSIPGVTDFIPYLEAPGLLTYDLRYSGPSTLLIKALQDVFGVQYEIGMKEIGDDSWEITMRRSGKSEY